MASVSLPWTYKNFGVSEQKYVISIPDIMLGVPPIMETNVLHVLYLKPDISNDNPDGMTNHDTAKKEKKIFFFSKS